VMPHRWHARVMLVRCNIFGLARASLVQTSQARLGSCVSRCHGALRACAGRGRHQINGRVAGRVSRGARRARRLGGCLGADRRGSDVESAAPRLSPMRQQIVDRMGLTFSPPANDVPADATHPYTAEGHGSTRAGRCARHAAPPVARTDVLWAHACRRHMAEATRPQRRVRGVKGMCGAGRLNRVCEGTVCTARRRPV
jgi:hypothetical protein